MNLTHPTRSIAPTLHLKVLAALARLEQPVTGRGLTRLLAGGASQRGVSNALAHLVEQGVVIRENQPPAALYRLNRDHVAAPAVEVLAGLRDRLRERCAAEVGSWERRPKWAAFFGSVVRGEGDEASDIDIVLVDDRVTANHAGWADDIDRLAERIHAWSGNHASIVAFTPEEWITSSEPVAAQIAAEAVTIWGRRPSRRAT